MYVERVLKRHEFSKAAFLLAPHGESRHSHAARAVGHLPDVPLRTEAQGVSPPPRTKWTRRVPHPVLTGHVSSLVWQVFVYRLVSWGTMEERIYKRQIRKQSRAARAVDSWQARPRSRTVPGRCRQNVSFSFSR